MPDPTACETLIEAKNRGVAVRIMVSGFRDDNWLARHNSVSQRVLPLVQLLVETRDSLMELAVPSGLQVLRGVQPTEGRGDPFAAGIPSC